MLQIINDSRNNVCFIQNIQNSPLLFNTIFIVSLSMGSGIKRYDLYRKAIDGLQVKTSVGGLSDLPDSCIICSIHYISYHNCGTNIDADLLFPRSENSYYTKRRISVGECNSG